MHSKYTQIPTKPHIFMKRKDGIPFKDSVFSNLNEPCNRYSIAGSAYYLNLYCPIIFQGSYQCS